MNRRELHRAERQAEKAKYTREQLEQRGVVPTYGMPRIRRVFRELVFMDSLHLLQDRTNHRRIDHHTARKMYEELKEKLKDKVLLKLPENFVERISDYHPLDT